MIDRARLPDTAEYFAQQGLALVGRGKWRTTSCPFHGGSDSMRVNVQAGSWVCMACSARGGDVLAFHRALHGLAFLEAAKALGCWQDEPRMKGAPRRRPMPFSPRDGLAVLAGEANLLAVAACNVAQGVVLVEADRARLLQAAARVRMVADWCEVE